MDHDSIRIRNFKVVSVMFIRAIILVAFLLVASIPAFVPDIQADPFKKGSRRVSIVAGSGRTISNDYIIVGLGVGYYVQNGLELGLDGEAWLGGDPDIYKLSPHANYILPTQSRFRPYVGAFYNHLFIDNYDDLDTIGGRGGVYFIQEKQWFFGIGAVYESYLNCDDTIYSSCDYFYPEITFSFSF
ncbi:MAG: hypothetical protein KJO26_01180 [Deltaproteobacteria bacterium]|nr:hypothetical protein [Deltaproteobacteria bacterium]